MSDESGGDRGNIRTRINDLDAQLLQILAQRRELSREVARAKTSGGLALRDTVREEDVLVRLVESGRVLGLDARYVTRLFHAIIDDSIRTQQHLLQHGSDRLTEQQPIRVAFQGDKGSYSHTAICEHFAAQLERIAFLGFENFSEAVEAVEQGAADYACLPIENTTSGGINEVYDALMHTSLSIVGEQRLRVAHCLLAREDVPLSSLRRVYAHPQGFAQCSRFIATLKDCQLEYCETAECVRRVHADAVGDSAAVASREAGELFGLRVLSENIANNQQNFTRFLFAARQARDVPQGIACKTSLVMATAQEPGSLVEALLLFRERNINLSKLESRPMPGNPWEEMFYLDLQGNLADPVVAQTLHELGQVTRYFKVLGSYASDDLPPTAVPVAALARGGLREGTVGASSAQGGESRVAGGSGQTAINGFSVGAVQVGGAGFVVAVAPAAGAQAEDIAATAGVVHEHGAQLLWAAGAMLAAAPGYLDAMHKAGVAQGLPLVAEVRTPIQLGNFANQADLFFIAGPDMRDRALLAAAGRQHRPVILERSPAATLDEWLEAAKFFMSMGNRQLAMCEAPMLGASGQGADFGLAVELMARSRLPLFLNLAHLSGAGHALPLLRAARALPAQGVIISLAPASGGPAGMSRKQFAAVMAQTHSATGAADLKV